MKDINLKNKKKIDNNCQCLCHFDTKQLLSSVKYCDRCIEIHKTEPISPFKPNGWEEELDDLPLYDGDEEPDGQGGYTASVVPLSSLLELEVNANILKDFIRKVVSQAILSAEERAREEITYDSVSPTWVKDEPAWTLVAIKGGKVIWESEEPVTKKEIQSIYNRETENYASGVATVEECRIAAKYLFALSLPDQEQLKIKK